MAYKNANYKSEETKTKEAKLLNQKKDLLNGRQLKADLRDDQYEQYLTNRSNARAFIPGLNAYDAWNDYNHGYATLGNALWNTGMDALTVFGLGKIGQWIAGKGPKAVYTKPNILAANRVNKQIMALIAKRDAYLTPKLVSRGAFPKLATAGMVGSRLGAYATSFRDPIERIYGPEYGVHENQFFRSNAGVLDATRYFNPAYTAPKATTEFYFETPQQLLQFLIDNGEDLGVYGADGKIGRETIYGINHIASTMNATDRANFLNQVRKFDTAYTGNSKKVDPFLADKYNRDLHPHVNFDDVDQYYIIGGQVPNGKPY